MNNLYKSVLTTKPYFRISKLLYSSNVSEEKIVIPKRIPRGPTDILNALSSTVGRDPTAPDYKYHDDPFLIPMSNVGKRTFAMAQEAGRKAAKWIRQENSSLFQHKIAEPEIQAFIPQMCYNEESQVEEKDLTNLIENTEVSDAILVYNLLMKNNIPVSDDVQQSLLELICFFNHEDPLPEEYIEEIWHKQYTQKADTMKKSWKTSGLADQIFDNIENKTAQHYCTLIRGLAKYGHLEKAWALYQETIEKAIEIDINTYNSLITTGGVLQESPDAQWQHIVNLLTAINTQMLKPNLGTLNAVLSATFRMRNKNSREYALQALNEFQSLGIEPSLGTYNLLLLIFCKDRGPVSYILNDIMKHIEGKEHKLQDVRDTQFFLTAMRVCQTHVVDKFLAERVDNLLNFQDNYNLVGDTYRENYYYRNYLSLLCATAPLAEFMAKYNSIVPTLFIPETMLMEEILQAISDNGAIEHIPLIWSQLLMFDYLNRQSLVDNMLTIMVSNRPNEEIANHAGLDEKFTEIAWHIWNRVEEMHSLRNKSLPSISWSASALGNILFLCCHTGHLEKAEVIFNKLDKDQNKILGEPKVNAMEAYVKLCIEKKRPTNAIKCIQLCVEIGFPESKSMAKLINDSMTLDGDQLSKLKNLVGPDALSSEEKL